MIGYLEYLNMPTVIGVAIIGLFLIMQIIGEIIEFMGKTAPEFMKLRKYQQGGPMPAEAPMDPAMAGGAAPAPEQDPIMMMAEGATVTQCHSHTKQLQNHTDYADIVVSAIGQPKFVTDFYVHGCQTVIDVGI